jgi:hypothetical protein
MTQLTFARLTGKVAKYVLTDLALLCLPPKSDTPKPAAKLVCKNRTTASCC